MGYKILLECSKVQIRSSPKQNITTPYLFKYCLGSKDVVCPRQGKRLHCRRNSNEDFSSGIGDSLAVGRFGYMGMVKTWSVVLQPRQFRMPNVRRTISDALKMQVNRLFKELIQCDDIVERIKEQLDSILKSFRTSADLISREKQAIVGLEEEQKKYSYHRCQPDTFMKKYGPIIMSLEETCKKSHKDLNRFETGLLLNCTNNDPLLLSVSAIYEKNKKVSREVAEHGNMFNDYCCRFAIETSWIAQMAKRLEENHKLFTLAEAIVKDMENELLELIDIYDNLIVYAREIPKNFEDQILSLRTLIRILVSTGIYSDICSWVDEYVSGTCCVCKNVRDLLSDKGKSALKFYLAEKRITHQIPKVKRLVEELQRKVDITRRSYNEKMSRIKDVKEPDTKIYIYQKGDDKSDDFSLRNREWGGKNLSPAIRKQGRGKCSQVATVSCTESLYKRMYANLQDEFILKLSPDHLEDMVNQFYKTNRERKPSEKLDVGLERLEKQGVLSEEAYNDANFDLQYYYAYRIKGFEVLNTANLDVARAKLNNGKALIGNYRLPSPW